MVNYLSPERQNYLVRGLQRGMTQRGLADQLELDRKTVARHARWLGRTARFLLDQQRELPLRYFQMDEFYTYVLAKHKNVGDVKSPVMIAGRFLHFLAVESDTGFIVNQMIAPSNGVEHTRRFIRDFDSRLARNEDGTYVNVPELISDGHGSYWRVLEDDEYKYHYGRFTKESTYEARDGRKLKKRMFGGITREVLQGTLRDPVNFDTQMVEAVNGSARALNMRVHKEAKSFSKRFAQHREQFALWAWSYNYAHVQARRKQTPAMAAGIDQRLWMPADLMRAAQLYREGLPDPSVLDQDDLSGLDFDVPDLEVGQPRLVWLYHSLVQKTTKAHHPTCRWCNHGAGLKNHFGATGIWLPFATFDEAKAHAEKMTPGRFTTCRDCFGERAYWRGRF